MKNTTTPVGSSNLTRASWMRHVTISVILAFIAIAIGAAVDLRPVMIVALTDIIFAFWALMIFFSLRFAGRYLGKNDEQVATGLFLTCMLLILAYNSHHEAVGVAKTLHHAPHDVSTFFITIVEFIKQFFSHALKG